MTLEQAVAILNERKHRSCDQWNAWDVNETTRWAMADDPYDALEEFEAIAIATAYQQQETK